MDEARAAAGNELPTGSVVDGSQDSFDQLAEEFAERCRNGESPAIEEYATRYPEHTARIRSLLPAVALMERVREGARASSQAERAWPMPENLGEFRIIRELGRGAMGIVYEADQQALGRHVAVKVIHDVHRDARRLQRFQREAQAVARLHHTNIVPIFAVGEHDGLPYYAMQYIQGIGLDALLNRWRLDGPPPPAERWRSAARMGAQVADALQYAHDQGVLHRDIKPANLLIDDQECVWVTDFGLAKLAGHEDLSASGDVIGTLRYMAPECLHGEADARSDVCSLGLTLYELLTLAPPFGELSPSELLRQVSERRPPPPRKVDAAIPRDLETVVLKAIAREPAQRYATAAALGDDLRRFLQDRPVRARRATALEEAWRWSRRNRATALLAAATAISLVLAAIIGWVGYVNTAQALRRSDQNVSLSLAVFEEIFARLSTHDEYLPPPPTLVRGQPETGNGPGGPLPHGFGGGPPPRGRGPGGFGFGFGPPPPSPFGGHGGPPGGPRAGPPPRGRFPQGPAERNASEATALLQSILTFYDRFAAQNATNPRLQGEAAWAYRKVGALHEQLGHEAGAEAAYAKAIAMFEGLVARYPDDRGYRFRLVQTYDMSDPWAASPASLELLATRLERAGTIGDGLAAEEPDNPDYVQTQIRVQMKLGRVLTRLKRPDDARTCYLRVIDLIGKQVDQARAPEDRLLDRATVREALALLELDRGRRDEARTILDAAAADAEEITRHPHLPPPLPGRFLSLAEAYHKLGDDLRAQELVERARALRRGPENDFPGPTSGAFRRSDRPE